MLQSKKEREKVKGKEKKVNKNEQKTWCNIISNYKQK